MPSPDNKKGTILILCAHSDDQVLGPGGAAAKYARQGYDVHTVIFSYGEVSHPHYKDSYIREIRVTESQNADRIMGGKGVVFLGMKDGKIRQDMSLPSKKENLRSIILSHMPVKIFTHSIDDMLPDHRAVRDAVVEAYDYLADNNGFSCDVYSFEVWNLWNILKRRKPMLVIDTSKEFKQKIRALREFKSQIGVFTHTIFVNVLYLNVYLKDFINGTKYGYTFAEVFYKIR